MQLTDIPDKSAKVFAQSAGGAFVRSIPQTTADPAAASFDIGFPPQTFTDEGAGGTPPDGRDWNGILGFLSEWTRWQSAGAPVLYDSAFSTAVGGYPKGASLRSVVDPRTLWVSTVDNNTTDPDGVGAANWVAQGYLGGTLNASKGHLVFPGGVIFNFGVKTQTGGTGLTQDTFDLPFTSIVLAWGAVNSAGAPPAAFASAGAVTLTTIDIWQASAANVAAAAGVSARYWAVGI